MVPEAVVVMASLLSIVGGRVGACRQLRTGLGSVEPVPQFGGVLDPGSAGGSRYSAGVADSPIGLATTVTASSPSPTVTWASRPSSAAKSNAPAMSLTGPQGTPSGVRTVNHDAAGCVDRRAVRASKSASTFATRSGLVAKRGSRARSGTSSPRHSAANWRSLPTAITIGWSAVGYTSYGAMDG